MRPMQTLYLSPRTHKASAGSDSGNYGVRPAIPADLGGGKTPLCAHERPLSSCRDEYTLQQRADFDAAHKAAYTYAIEVSRERDDAERFAAAVAEVAACSGLEYIDLHRDLAQWIREGVVT